MNCRYCKYLRLRNHRFICGCNSHLICGFCEDLPVTVPDYCPLRKVMLEDEV